MVCRALPENSAPAVRSCLKRARLSQVSSVQRGLRRATEFQLSQAILLPVARLWKSLVWLPLAVIVKVEACPRRPRAKPSARLAPTASAFTSSRSRVRQSLAFIVRQARIRLLASSARQVLHALAGRKTGFFVRLCLVASVRSRGSIRKGFRVLLDISVKVVRLLPRPVLRRQDSSAPVRVQCVFFHVCGCLLCVCFCAFVYDCATVRFDSQTLTVCCPVFAPPPLYPEGQSPSGETETQLSSCLPCFPLWVFFFSTASDWRILLGSERAAVPEVCSRLNVSFCVKSHERPKK